MDNRNGDPARLRTCPAGHEGAPTGNVGESGPAPARAAAAPALRARGRWSTPGEPGAGGGVRGADRRRADRERVDRERADRERGRRLRGGETTAVDGAELRARAVGLVRQTTGDVGDVAVLSAPGAAAGVCRVGRVVVKVHRSGTDPSALGRRLRIAVDPRAGALVLPPLEPVPRSVPGTDPVRWATLWPPATPVPPDPESAPWSVAAALLAGLHRLDPVVPGGRSPVCGAPQAVLRALTALSGLGADAAATDVFAAAERLPRDLLAATSASVGRTLVHGDWHLGQLLRGAGGWRLADIDDLGIGDPRWDLGRPAAFAAIGVLPPADLEVFLDAYREAGGPALAGERPWAVLDGVARAFVVRAAATGLLRARRDGDGMDDVLAELLGACRRMALPPVRPG